MVKLNLKSAARQKLSYFDGENVIFADGQYLLIAQCGPGKMMLVVIDDGMEWNRKCEPVEVVWQNLDTETIKQYVPLKSVERVNCVITFDFC